MCNSPWNASCDGSYRAIVSTISLSAAATTLASLSVGYLLMAIPLLSDFDDSRDVEVVNKEHNQRPPA